MVECKRERNMLRSKFKISYHYFNACISYYVIININSGYKRGKYMLENNNSYKELLIDIKIQIRSSQQRA